MTYIAVDDCWGAQVQVLEPMGNVQHESQDALERRSGHVALFSQLDVSI